MFTRNNKKNSQREITLDGLMTLGKLDNNLHTAEIECCEDVTVEAFAGRFKVQGMRDGNIYMTEMPKRVRNRKPLFKQANSTLSLGRDGYYYIRFRLPESEIDELPRVLMSEATKIARWVKKYLLNRIHNS